MNKKIFAVLCAALFICLCVVSSFAIVPPSPSNTLVSGRPSYDSAEDLISLVNYQTVLGSFNSVIPTLVYFDGSYVRLLGCLPNSLIYPVLRDGIWTFEVSNIRQYQYSLTNGGFGLVSTAYTISIGSSNVLGYRTSLDSDLVFNSDFTGGSFDFSSIFQSWQSYYDKVYFYDDNIESAYDQGVADGGAEQYREGYDDGYSDGSADGYETGYSDGFSSGYSSGLSIGQASGLQQGRQEGYDTGYSEGFQDGLESGYLSGKSDGYIQGNQEGFQVGLSQGRQEGYETGFDEGYETGYADGFSAGGGSSSPDPSYVFTVGFANDSLSGAGVSLRLIWDGSNPDTLTFGDYSDPFSLPSGFSYYTVSDSFTQSQIDSPSSIHFAIPSVLRQKFPDLNFAYVVITSDSPQLRTALCYLYPDSFDAGYNQGFQSGANLLDGLGTLAAAPVNSLVSVLDFDIFGVNVKAVLIGVLCVVFALLAWRVIKRFVPV